MLIETCVQKTHAKPMEVVRATVSEARDADKGGEGGAQPFLTQGTACLGYCTDNTTEAAWSSRVCSMVQDLQCTFCSVLFCSEVKSTAGLRI